MKRFLLALLLLTSCASLEAPPDELFRPAEAPPVGDEIIVCGKRFATGTRVVLWTDPPRYDASSTRLHFDGDGRTSVKDGTLRYQPGRVAKGGTVLLEPGSGDVAAAQEVIDQFVLHYDVCGLSSTCFKVLHDLRGLSVHFLLDIDGTIYQTMDLRDQAWHATKANARSIGIEIANIGSYARTSAGHKNLDEWYRQDADGTRIQIPKWKKEAGVRTHGFVGRPARSELVTGMMQGQLQDQYDFTAEQYDALVKLTATLCQVFPEIAADAPRDATNRVQKHVLADGEWQRFRGILGHHHVQENKTDPGPAFDWERFLARVRSRTMAGN